MIIWGAMWGAILSVFVSRWGDFEWIVGALLGALAGWTLRKAVRSEVARATQQQTLYLPADPSTTGASTDVAAVIAPPVVATPRTDDAMLSLAGAATDAAQPAAAAGNNPAAPPQPATASAAAVAEPAPEPKAPATPNLIETLITRGKDWLFGGNTVARVGTVVLFIGLSFLAKWAADNALFPPEFRLAAIGIVGIVLLVQGFRLARTNTGDASRSNYALSCRVQALPCFISRCSPPTNCTR